MHMESTQATGSHRLIDVHHHFEPTARNAGGTRWSIEMALGEMDRNGVATAIGYGGPIFADAAPNGRTAARAINEWSTNHCLQHPGRFGLFASIPMDDVDGSMAEIAYAFDVLHADGIGIAPKYGDAWLGDAKFRPIFEELNRRSAVVYVHPARASSSGALATLNDEHGLICAPWIEYPTDTARTILSLWAARMTRELPNVKFLFCHGGGVMPILLGRFAGFAAWREMGPERLASIFPDGVYAEFAKLYFECAQAYAPEAFAMLRSLVPVSHVLFGTDFSYFPISHSVALFNDLVLAAEERRLISGENAGALLPRWSAHA